MPRIPAALRATLLDRLREYALIRELAPLGSLESQIDQLLAEVLRDEPIAAAERLAIDDEDADQRIVITGLGLVTPFGVGVQPFWDGIAAGHSAIGPITAFDPHDFPAQIAGEVRSFEPRAFMEAKEARRMSRASQFAVAAARMALADAALTVDATNRELVGCLIACATNSMHATEQAMRTLIDRGPGRVSPFFIPLALPNMPAANVALQFDLRGYTTSISTACAASTQAIGEAAAVIRRGDADVMLAGGTDASIERLALGGFCALRALSTRNDDPTRASRPFDAQRDGFVLGEGAGVLVLERLSAARRRGASIYAELVGYASTCDAHHITAPDPVGEGAARAMRIALTHARIVPQQVDYINAHATGTPTGDVAETHAIKQIFGEYAYSVPISATKSMIGHLTGAAGAVEAGACLLAMRHTLLPPTINLEYPDPECDLDYIPNAARPAEPQIVMSNSFGFGGVNAVLIFRA